MGASKVNLMKLELNHVTETFELLM